MNCCETAENPRGPRDEPQQHVYILFTSLEHRSGSMLLPQPMQLRCTLSRDQTPLNSWRSTVFVGGKGDAHRVTPRAGQSAAIVILSPHQWAGARIVWERLVFPAIYWGVTMTEETLSDRVAQSEEFNFIAFSKDEAYRDANRQLLREVFSRLPSPFFHVDVASGTGLVPQEVSALCQKHGKQGTIIGVDPDHFAVESARKNTPAMPLSTVEYLVGRGQDLVQLLAGKVPPEGVDYVSIHDALHEVEEEDKQSVLRYIEQILKPGGLFTYNSAFTTAAMEESPMQWGRWKSKAFSILGGKRNRKIKGLITHTPEEYRDMVTQAGLTIVYEAKQSIVMSRFALETIAIYPRFVYGVFGDFVSEAEVSLAQKSRALIQALDDLGLADVPRVWHELIAQKPVNSAG